MWYVRYVLKYRYGRSNEMTSLKCQAATSYYHRVACPLVCPSVCSALMKGWDGMGLIEEVSLGRRGAE